MTEREMLELAAKAARYVVRWHGDTLTHGPTFAIEVEPGNPCGFEPWNPLADDGDALRLAVALRITIEFDGCYVYANDTDLEVPDDAGAAAEVVRQAIVMAAAEIGRAMP